MKTKPLVEWSRHQVAVVVVMILVILSIRWCHADAVCSGMCPVVDGAKCVCTIKPLIAGSNQVGNYVSCSGLGNLTAVPAYSCSSSLTEFSIMSSTLTTLQRLAFTRIKAESLWLTDIGISSVDEQAFSGLENVLQTISLGYNKIGILSGKTFSRLVNLGSVILENNQLTEVASGLFRNLSQVVNINLQSNNISTVHGDAFDGLDMLQTLDMSRNFIAELPANFLIGAAQVRELRLSGNRLTSLVSPAFNSMPNMITLDLSQNLLNYLPPNMLPGCQKLNILYLSSNNITSISSLAIAALRQLQIIYAQNNNIGLIPYDAFLNASTLKEVSFANNKIGQLDPGLFRNTIILQTLNLSNNLIPSVPDDVFPVSGSNVKIFDISHNRLSEATFLVRLPNLIIADLSFNQIYKINFTITPQLNILRVTNNQLNSLKKDLLGRLPNLKELYLDFNLIDSVESGWMDFNPTMQILSVGNNLLTTVPVLNGTKLTVLRLNDNSISSVSMLNCPVLSELYLQNNLLGTVTETMLFGLTNLKILDLRNNSIFSVPEAAFESLTNLQVLKLARNGILTVSSEDFYGLFNLRSIDLSGNELQTLTYETMTGLLSRKLTSMFLASNPFICSCEILWIRGSRVLQDINTSICYLNTVCYRLMCNPVKSCQQTVRYLHNDSDPFCLEVPSSCPKLTTTLTTDVQQTLASTTGTLVPFKNPIEEVSTATHGVDTATGNPVSSETSKESTTQMAASMEDPPSKTYIYIIIGVVIGVFLLLILVIVIVCLVRRRVRNKKDPLTKTGEHRGSINDTVGILKGDQSSTLEDPPPTPGADSGEGKQSQLLPIFTPSESEVDSGYRPRPKGSTGFPYGNFRFPGSDGRRWRAGGQVDRPPYEFDEEPGPSEENDKTDDDAPDRKKRRNESRFNDDDGNSNLSEDSQLPSKFANYLLWRGGNKGPYKTEKLPIENDEDIDKKNQRRTEFSGDQESSSYPDLEDSSGASKYGGGLLWRGGPKGPYKTEKMSGENSEDGKDKNRKKQKMKSEFNDDDESNPDLEDFSRSSKYGGDLLWRGGPKGPYKTEKLPKDWDEDDEDKNRTSERLKSEFVDNPDDSRFFDLDDFQNNVKPNLLWRGGKNGPYRTEKMSKDYLKDNDDDPEDRRKRTTEFIDDDGRSGMSGDLRLPSTSGLLWRKGQKGPYDTEKLPKGFCKDDEEEGAGERKQKLPKSNSRNKSEFNDGEDQFPSPNNDQYRLPSGIGAGLLWRGNKKDPYSTEKLTLDESSGDTLKETSGKKSHRRGRMSEFVGDEEQFSQLNSDTFRMPSTGTDLLWRATQKGPYSTSKMTIDDALDGSDTNKKTPKTSKRRSEFANEDEAFPLPSSSDGFRLPSKPGSDLLWRRTQGGPYSTEKLSKDYSADDRENDANRKVDKKQRRRTMNSSDFVDSASDGIYAAGNNFRFPSMSGDDLLWRSGQKRPYNTVRLAREYSDSGISSFAGTSSQLQGPRDRRRKRIHRRKSNETEFMDSDGNSSLHSSSFGGYRLPGDRSMSGLQWRSSRFGEELPSPTTASERISFDDDELSRRRRRRRKRRTDSSSDLEDRSNLSDPYEAVSFGNYKTNPNRRPNTLYWKTDRMSTGFTPTSGSSSPVTFDGTHVRRNSGSDQGVYSDDGGRKPESPTSDHFRRPFGTAKEATAWKKTQQQNGNMAKIDDAEINC